MDQLSPVENNLNDAEYEFLSREPSELTEETYRLPANNKIPSSKYHVKSRSVPEHHNKKVHPSQVAQPRSDDIHPTGLVTKLGGTVVNKDGKIYMKKKITFIYITFTLSLRLLTFESLF